jgi:hypothetical protein
VVEVVAGKLVEVVVDDELVVDDEVVVEVDGDEVVEVVDVAGCAIGARKPIFTTVPPPAALATVSTQVRWPGVPQ